MSFVEEASDAFARRTIVAFLKGSKRECWTEFGSRGWTVLHDACLLDEPSDLAAVRYLLANGADPNIPDAEGRYPVHIAACADNSKALQLLCARGALLKAARPNGRTPIDYGRNPECTRVLIANGVRLDTMKRKSKRRAITEEMRTFEATVLTLRAQCVIIMGVKRFRGVDWKHVDRFLFREIAFAVWATRNENL